MLLSAVRMLTLNPLFGNCKGIVLRHHKNIESGYLAMEVRRGGGRQAINAKTRLSGAGRRHPMPATSQQRTTVASRGQQMSPPSVNEVLTSASLG